MQSKSPFCTCLGGNCGSVREVVLFGTAQIGLATALSSALGVKTAAIIKRVLRSHSSRGEASVQIGAAHGLQFRYSFCEEHGKAPNEGVAGAATIHALYRESRHMLVDAGRNEERTVGPQGNDHAPNPARHQLLCTLLCVVNISYWSAANGLRLTFIRDEVIEISEGAHFNRLSGSRIKNATNP